MSSNRLVAAAFVGASLVVVVALTAAQQRGGSNPSIIGVWKVAEVTTTGPNARTISSPQPGLRIFTQRHYSVTEVQGR